MRGISGGGAFFAYSLAHYGLKNIFDYLEILSGPSVSKLDYGCDPSLYQGGPRYLCPLLPKWTADSIVSPGADYDYPQTGISFWFCGGTMLNESSGLGSFLVDKVQPLGQPPVVNCYSRCMGENVLGDPSAKTASVSFMVAGCIPRH